MAKKHLPEVNNDQNALLKTIKMFALDMDGTIYLGEKWIDGAKDFLKAVEESGRDYMFLTNNSSKNANVYVEKLKRMGLEVDESKIVTSGQATIFYLQQNFPGKKVYLLGNPLLQEEFRQAGIELVEEGAEVVVTAFDTTLDYAKMCRVCDYVRAGLPYIATHPDYNCPTEDGFIPDAGAIHAFIHASAFRYPDRIIGKPNGDIIDYLMSRVNGASCGKNTAEEGRGEIARNEIAMVGDRLYTDVAAGCNNGLNGVLVLSGEATMQDAEESDVNPALIFSSVKEMIPLL